jgi:hypothetical protein
MHSIKIQLNYVVSQGSDYEDYRIFWCNSFFNLQKEAACFSKTLMYIYQNIRRHIS